MAGKAIWKGYAYFGGIDVPTKPIGPRKNVEALDDLPYGAITLFDGLHHELLEEQMRSMTMTRHRRSVPLCCQSSASPADRKGHILRIGRKARPSHRLI